MRTWAAMAAVISALTVAAPAAAQAPDVIWERAIDPHGPERRAILSHTTRIRDQVNAFEELARATPTTVRARRERARILGDARGMLRYALSREPDHLELLLRAGEIAELSGHSTEAIAAYERAVKVAPRSSKAPHLELAELYARRGDTRRAISSYRVVLETQSFGVSYNKASLALAWVYMSAGRNADAIELLSTRNPSVYARHVDPMIELVLAVAYDRDGQRAKSHHVLEKLLKNGNPVDTLLRRRDALVASTRLASPLDLHYAHALIFEITDMLEEAHAEWLFYASGGPAATFRGRALEHAREIEVLLHARNATSRAKKQKASTR